MSAGDHQSRETFPHPQTPGLVPSSPPWPLSPTWSPCHHQHYPDTFLSLRHSFQGLDNFSAGLDLLVRHFLEWPPQCLPSSRWHPDANIPPSPIPLSPALASQLREINPDTHLTPTSLHHWLYFLGLRAGLTPLPTSLSKARASGSPQPLFNSTGNCSVSQSKCQHDNESGEVQTWPYQREESRACDCVQGAGGEGLGSL